MKALVTGGAGFIGSHLVDGLLACGWEVAALDNLSTGRRANIAHLEHDARFALTVGDICDEAAVERLVRGCDVVFHLAALVGVKYVVDDPLLGMRTNVRGTEVVLEACMRHGARACVASSSEVYGNSPEVPYREDGPRLLGPTWIPRWSYASAKALDEHLAFAYHAQGLPVSIVRYFNSYGPRLDPRGYGSVIARFITQALAGEPITVHGDGRQSRSFTFVTDTAAGTILAGTRPEAIGQALNIGHGQETTIAELAERIAALTGTRSAITTMPYEAAYGPNFADCRRRVPDIDKARRLLGFVPQIPLDEGLQRTIEWMRRDEHTTGSLL